MNMNIETTTCISYEHLDIIKYHAKKHKMSVRTFISCLIRFAADDEKEEIRYFKQLRYRPRKNVSVKISTGYRKKSNSYQNFSRNI